MGLFNFWKTACVLTWLSQFNCDLKLSEVRIEQGDRGQSNFHKPEENCFDRRGETLKWLACLSLSSNLIVQRPEVLGGGAVHVEPPVADEVLLLEESPVGAEEGELGQTRVAVVGADVESL